MNEKEIRRYDDLAKKLARHLGDIREEKGIAKVDLAQMSGLSRSAILKIEKGERIPSISTLMRIAVSLDVELWKVLKDLT